MTSLLHTRRPNQGDASRRLAAAKTRQARPGKKRKEQARRPSKEHEKPDQPRPASQLPGKLEGKARRGQNT